MSGGYGRRATGGGHHRRHGRQRRRFSLSPFLPLALLLLGGCGLLGINLGGGSAGTGAHTVFLAPDGCGTFLARTLGRDFILAEAAEAAYTPSPGDVLAGPTRVGPSVFGLYPSGSDFAGTPALPPAENVPLDVLAVGLPLAEARALLDTTCGVAP